MKRLLQLSGVIVDLVYEVREVPLPGEEAIVGGFQLSAGGGFNAMVAACRSGMHTTYGGGLGNGPLSDMVRKELQREHISTIQDHRTDRDQGCCTVLIDSSGERTFIAKEGAEGIVSHEHLSTIDPEGFDWILISGYALVYEGSRIAIADWIEQLPDGPQLIFDPCPLVASIPKDILNKVMARCSWISCNSTEAEYLTGLASIASATEVLANLMPTSGGAVVRHGESGCTLAHGNHDALTIPGFVVHAIDTNGAGDSHVGTFIAALARELEPPIACSIANAAAALSTTIAGPATTPRLDDVMEFITRFTSTENVESTLAH